MDYTDYLWWKLSVLTALAGVYHFWKGYTDAGRPRYDDNETAKSPQVEERPSQFSDKNN
jgi:hypothetical protein